jgi:hypothetical protein
VGSAGGAGAGRRVSAYGSTCSARYRQTCTAPWPTADGRPEKESLLPRFRSSPLDGCGAGRVGTERHPSVIGVPQTACPGGRRGDDVRPAIGVPSQSHAGLRARPAPSPFAMTVRMYGTPCTFSRTWVCGPSRTPTAGREPRSANLDTPAEGVLSRDRFGRRGSHPRTAIGMDRWTYSCPMFNSPTPAPVYRKIVSGLRDAITRGEYSSGARVPGESEVRDEWRVSRMTAKRRSGRLRWHGHHLPSNGLRRRQPGRGAKTVRSGQAAAVAPNRAASRTAVTPHNRHGSIQTRY